MATRLGVVAKPVLVMNPILFQRSLKLFLNKMSSIVTNENPRDFKTRENHLLENTNHYLGVIFGASKGLHPFKDIVVLGGWEGSYEVHTPDIKDLDLKYVVYGYFIPP